MKIHGIDYPGIEPAPDPHQRCGQYPCSCKPMCGPGSYTVRCGCGWENRLQMGGQMNYDRDADRWQHALEYHADRCPKAKGTT